MASPSRGIIRTSPQPQRNRQERMQRRYARLAYPARLTLRLDCICEDGVSRAWERWSIECGSAAAIKAVKKYFDTAAARLNQLIIEDRPDTPSDISDPAA